MGEVIVQSIVTGLITGAAAAIATFAAIRVELKYLRRDVDHAHGRIDKVEEKLS